MPELSYQRIALGVYVFGLVLTVVYNVFNGRIGATRPRSSANKSAWVMCIAHYSETNYIA
jgi:hypothetical protein